MIHIMLHTHHTDKWLRGRSSRLAAFGHLTHDILSNYSLHTTQISRGTSACEVARPMSATYSGHLLRHGCSLLLSLSVLNMPMREQMRGNVPTWRMVNFPGLKGKGILL